MFFSISKTPNSNFPNITQYGAVYLNLDEGWQRAAIGFKDVIYKGYLDGNFIISLSRLRLQKHKEAWDKIF